MAYLIASFDGNSGVLGKFIYKFIFSLSHGKNSSYIYTFVFLLTRSPERIFNPVRYTGYNFGWEVCLWLYFSCRGVRIWIRFNLYGLRKDILYKKVSFTLNIRFLTQLLKILKFYHIDMNFKFVICFITIKIPEFKFWYTASSF